MSETVTTRSPEETIRLGKSFAARLRPGDVVAILGDLGTGKTRFVMGVCEALGARGHVASPTFTLINEYPASFGSVVHIDMYRIGSRRELRELGIEEYFDDRHVCLIEWAETVRDLLPPDYYQVEIAHGADEQERTVRITRSGR
jgi:tRNA threonylcarbamoyladenosine biosynthesis protein TsaE